jgi:hypothetical protein
LMWRTEGRGERDREHIDELDVYQGVLRPGPSHFSFHFNLPDAPWSYAGHYIQIVWGIEVVLDVRWARDPKAFEPFILRAR